MTPKQKQKAEYLHLLQSGFNQKEASEKIGISEKTGGCWAKEIKKTVAHLQTVKQNLIKRLEVETANINTPTNHIHNLASALSVIDRQLQGHL